MNSPMKGTRTVIKKGAWVRITNPEVYGQVVAIPRDPNSSPEDQFYKIEVPSIMYKRETSLELLPDPGPSRKENYENFLKLNTAFKKDPTFENAQLLLTAYMVLFPAPERK
jgi:hypothetical protein